MLDHRRSSMIRSAPVASTWANPLSSAGWFLRTLIRSSGRVLGWSLGQHHALVRGHFILAGGC